MKRFLGVLLAGLGAAPGIARADTPVTGAVELKLGGYRPSIDTAPGVSGAPYNTAFGDRSLLLFEAEYDHQFWQKFGSLAVGLSAGYGEIYGKGIFAAGEGSLSGTQSQDNTALKVVPLKLLAVYRFDVLAKRYHIPLVPYGKFGLVWVPFEVLNGAGDVATTVDGSSQGKGARWGWEGDLGLAFLLDWLDESLAKDFDLDVGVNHSYFFAEWSDMAANRDNPFAAPQENGFWLGAKYVSFGLTFEF